MRVPALSLIVLGAGAGGCDSAKGVVVPAVDPGAPEVPAPPPPKPGDGPGATLALRRVRLGALGDDGAAEPSAWTTLGRNLDGRDDQTPPYLGHCSLVGGADLGVFRDGVDGIDNTFGSHLLPGLVLQVSPAAEEDTNARLADGTWTLLVEIDGLGAGPSYAPLAARVKEGGPLGLPPVGDGSDVWPVFTQPELSLPESYLVDDTWVSAPAGTLRVRVELGGYPLFLRLHEARLVLALSPDRQSAQGVVAGVLDPEELVAEAHAIAGFFSSNPCIPAMVGGLDEVIRESADIDLGGPTLGACNGISVGLGVEFVRAQLGAPVDPPPAPCAP